MQEGRATTANNGMFAALRYWGCAIWLAMNIDLVRNLARPSYINKYGPGYISL